MKTYEKLQIQFHHWNGGKHKEDNIELRDVQIDMVGKNRIRLMGDTVDEKTMDKAVGYVDSKGRKRGKGKGSHVLIMFPAYLGGAIIGEEMKQHDKFHRT